MWAVGVCPAATKSASKNESQETATPSASDKPRIEVGPESLEDNNPVHKGKAAGIAMVAVISALAAYTLWPNTNKLRMIGPNPIPVTIESVSDIEARSKIDFKLPLLGRVTYPKSYTGNFRVKDIGRFANLLDPALYSGVFYRTGDQLLLMSAVVSTATDRWTISGLQIEVGGSMNPTYVRCPWVFGSKPLPAKVVSEAMGEELEFHVQLPANGKPEPAIPQYTVHLGDWLITLKPKPWVGPAFPIRYAITVDDKRDSVFLLRMSYSAENIPDDGYQPMLRCAPGETTNFQPRRLGWPLGGRTNGKHKVDLTAFRLTATEMEMTVRSRAEGKVRIKEIVGKDGRTYARLGPGYGTYIGARIADGIAGVRFDQTWACWDSSSNFESMDEIEVTDTYINSLAIGQKIAGKVYRVAETRKTTLTLNLPNGHQ